VDEYGFTNLLAHARAAGWTPRQFDLVVSPAFVRALRDRTGTSAVVRQLEVPIALAVERGDARLAFRWGWTARLLRRGMSEALSGEAPILLVRTGRAAAAVDALAVLDPTERRFSDLLGSLVEALGTESHLDLAWRVVDRSPDALRSTLLLSLARGLARHRPELAAPVLDEALQEQPAHGFDTQLGKVAALLAVHRGHEKRAWQLAQMAGEGAEEVVAAVAGHDLRLAAALAVESRSGSAVALVCQRAAGPEPDLATQLWRQLAGDSRPWWQATIALARHGRLGASPPGEVVRHHGHNGVRHALFVAAGSNSYPAVDDALRAAEELLADYRAWYHFQGLDDCRLVGDIDLSFTAEVPFAARRLISTAVSEAISNGLGDEESRQFDEEANAAVGRACGSVACVDSALAAQLLAEIVKHRKVRPDEVRQALLSRLTPRDPDRAWAVVADSGSHSVYRAWIEALPSSSVALGVNRIAEIDARYSASRAELTGLLAMKLPPGGGPEADKLLHLLVHPLDSEIYLGERRMMTAVARHTSSGEAPWAEGLVERVVSRGRGDVARRLALELRPAEQQAPDRGGDPVREIEGAARRAAARSKSDSSALLCHIAADLAQRAMPDLARRLAEEALHPVY
jgi:hypothetical protein